MNQQQAKREACQVAAALIQDYLDAGQPNTDCDEGRRKDHRPEGDRCRDCDREAKAHRELVDELNRRGGRDGDQ